jgi:hypothetical protein
VLGLVHASNAKAHTLPHAPACTCLPPLDVDAQHTHLCMPCSALLSCPHRCDLPTPLLERIAKCGVMDNILSFAAFKNQKELKKSDGAKRSRLTGELCSDCMYTDANIPQIDCHTLSYADW